MSTRFWQFNHFQLDFKPSLWGVALCPERRQLHHPAVREERDEARSGSCGLAGCSCEAFLWPEGLGLGTGEQPLCSFLRWREDQFPAQMQRVGIRCVCAGGAPCTFLQASCMGPCTCMQGSCIDPFFNVLPPTPKKEGIQRYQKYLCV